MPELAQDQASLFDLDAAVLFALPPALRKARALNTEPKRPRHRRTFARIRQDHAAATLAAPHLMHLTGRWPKLTHDYVLYKTLGDMDRTRRRAAFDQLRRPATGVAFDPCASWPSRMGHDDPLTKDLPEPARPPARPTQRAHVLSGPLAAFVHRLDIELDNL